MRKRNAKRREHRLVHHPLDHCMGPENEPDLVHLVFVALPRQMRVFQYCRHYRTFSVTGDSARYPPPSALDIAIS